MLLVASLAALSLSDLRAQRANDYRATQDSVNTADPSETFLKAFTAVQQGEKLEEDGKLRPALAKYRFAASLLEQLNQTNPNWQPLIVRYRIRKTTENIRKLEDKLTLQPPPETTAGNRPATPAGSSPGGEDDDLPVPDAQVTADGQVLTPPAPVDLLNRSTMAQSAKFAKLQQDLKTAQDALNSAKKDRQDAITQRQDLERQLHGFQTSATIINRRLDRLKTDRDDLQKQLDKAQARLTDALSKNPKVAESRKELTEQVATLKKSVAKAEADTVTAQKERDLVNQKLAEEQGRTAKAVEERDKAVAINEENKDSIGKIQSLQTENDALTKKLTDAEASIARLSADAIQKKEELEGMQKELTTVKNQLATTRDQQDRSETTITELRQKLDQDAKQLADYKSKGMSSEDFTRMTEENTQLKSIVMRQLKVEAGRALARKLVSDELARLEVQSKVLNEQIENLGRPTVPLTDEERALFKDPQVTLSDSADPSTYTATITAFKPKSSPDPAASLVTPSADASAAPASTNTNPTSPTAQASPTDDAASPTVETGYRPKVSDELKPLALQAKESLDRGKLPEAEETYKKLIARDPKNAYLLSNQGVVLARQNKLKSAEISLKKALAVDDKDAFSLATLGIVYYRMHRYDDALEGLTKAVQIDPKNATAHNYLGITSSQKGWPEAALEEVQKAIALNPQYADAHFNIAVIYATMQPPAKEQALEHYKMAISLGAASDAALEKLIGKK